MIDLRERLSEFSYGYGVTREVEQLLSGIGLRTVPFLPSLLEEKKIGCDVKFNGRGAPVLLQFKLGHSLTRFVRSDKSHPAPLLERPFFRFSINTAEPDGQFETLLKAETDGCEVYYVAPRFADWPYYARFYEAGEILERSTMITPKAIRLALNAKNEPDGNHRIVYDRNTVHVCSTPTNIKEIRPDALAQIILNRVERHDENLSEALRRVYAGLDDRAAIRRRVKDEYIDEDMETAADAVTFDERSAPEITRRERAHRFAEFRKRASSEDDAVAAALGFELWALGIQLLFATEKNDTET